MKIYNFEVIDRCLFLKNEKILVIGDLHLGYEDAILESGISIPRIQFEETMKILERVFEKIEKVEKIIILGDVKHDFGGILKQESQDIYRLIDYLRKKLEKDGEIVITKGNHDTILQPLVKNYKEVKLVDYFVLENILFFHGDDRSLKNVYEILRDKKIKTVVIGHFHPAYILKDSSGVKKEKYKCFLYGFSKEYGKNTIFVPSFFPLMEGSDIIQELEIYERGMELVLIDENGKLYNFKNIS